MYNDPKKYENYDIYEYDDGKYEEYESEARLDERIRRQIAKEQQLIDELEADATDRPIESDTNDNRNEQPERKLLRRELQAQALARLEDAARTQKDFENVIAWWDRLDANRERRERYHELSRSGDDLPLDYGASEDLRRPSQVFMIRWANTRRSSLMPSISGGWNRKAVQRRRYKKQSSSLR